MKTLSTIMLVLGLNCDFEAYQGGDTRHGPKGRPPHDCKCCASQGGCTQDDDPPSTPMPTPSPQPPEAPPCNPPKPCEIPK